VNKLEKHEAKLQAYSDKVDARMAKLDKREITEPTLSSRAQLLLTGNRNVAVGCNALTNSTWSNTTTFIGRNAMRPITS